MIAINWGTSKFRAYWLDANGTVRAERISERGVATIPQAGFPDALIAEVGEWIDAGESQILMSGMVGSRSGWEEAPYINVPATFEQIVRRAIRLNTDLADVRIVPGLIGEDEDGIPEVMRGEETEILGVTCARPDSSCICLPGTHTKWVRMNRDAISSFTTSMTGDLYRAVQESTFLRTVIEGTEFDEQTFIEGVRRSQQASDLLHHLFGVRTLALMGRIRHSSAASYLSGLLIGHDIKPAARMKETVHLVGDSELCARYATALRAMDAQATIEEAHAALRGLKRIAARLEW